MVFRPAERELGYALLIGPMLTTPSLRSILMAVQAHILRALLFNVTSSKLLKSGYVKNCEYSIISQILDAC